MNEPSPLLKILLGQLCYYGWVKSNTNSPVCRQLLEQQIAAMGWILGEVFTEEVLLSLSLQFSSVQSLSHVRLFVNPMNRSMPGLPVHHQLPEFTQTHVH